MDTCRHTTKKEKAQEPATRKCSFYLQAPASTKLGRDFTGSRGGHLFPVLKHFVPVWVITNRADQLDLKQEKEKQQTHCAANTDNPNTKAGKCDLRFKWLFNFQSVRFHRFVTEIFPYVLKPQNLLVIIPASTHFLACLHLLKLPGTRIASFLLRYNTTKLKWAICALTFAVPTHPESNTVEWAINFDKITSNTGHQVASKTTKGDFLQTLNNAGILYLAWVKSGKKNANKLPSSYYSLRHGNVLC